MKLITTRLVMLLVLGLFVMPSWAGKPTPTPTTKSTPQQLFQTMKIALEKKDQATFASQWDSRGYKSNLVGSSGLPGRAVFSQGSRKAWYLKPDFKKTTTVTKEILVLPCAIWSLKAKRAVDEVHAVIVLVKEKWLILGAGENKKEVLSLAQKYKDKKL